MMGFSESAEINGSPFSNNGKDVGLHRFRVRTGTRIRFVAVVARVAFGWVAMTAMTATSQAADTWAASPYNVRVWIALEPVPELQDGWSARIPKTVRSVLEATFGSAWKTTIQDAPIAASRALAADVDWLSIDDIKALDADVLELDKLFVVGVQVTEGGLVIRVRELDCRSRSWQATRSDRIQQPGRVAHVVARQIVESFTPIGIIGRSQDDHVSVNMRAGMLSGGTERERLMPPDKSIFRAVLRKNDRLGKLSAQGLQPIEWTLLRVDGGEYADVRCEVITGLKRPFRSRTSRQVERLALLIKPTFDETRLRLHAKDDESQTLTGYDIYYRLPDEKSTALIGRTNWQGEVIVKKDLDPIKIMYVKNGGRLLARLPIVPGFRRTTTAGIVDDSRRLEAEGFLKGIQEQMIEIKARQQVYGIRIRKAMKDKKWDKADDLLEELRSLPTKADLSNKMGQRQQSLSSGNRAVQDRIDRMFRDTRSLIQEHLNSSEVDQLRRELVAARNLQ